MNSICCNLSLWILSFAFYLSCLPNGGHLAHTTNDEKIKYNEVKSWADKLGTELTALGYFITRKKEVEDSFKSVPVVSRNGQKLAEDMATDIKNMMASKVGAIKRIMETAENTALSFDDLNVNVEFPYYNAKEMLEAGDPEPTKRPLEFNENEPVTATVAPKQIALAQNAHFFDNFVNTSVSSVHVPTNVFDRAFEVIKAIQWSETLDEHFRSNYLKDPTLSWQFFCSSTGFMRQFPAAKWKQDTVDLYDCRLRSWYINAANSPKDMVIMIDNSGSMTGQRQDIARHVVHSILDTLSTNDYVNIFTFSDVLYDIVPCFRDTLVQANMENIRELKLGMEEFNTTEIANFTAAFTKAFDMLEKYRLDRMGARCNQAIMLISDGVPESYKEMFEQYNWINSTHMPVRVFTYLIGREEADITNIKWMACANLGYFVHLSTLAEVREQVLNYIAVMARPIVLGRNDHPVIWADVYADVVDPKMTDWLWEVKECKEQKERFLSGRKNKDFFFSQEEQDRRALLKLKEHQDQTTNNNEYIFMTTVAMPVFDLRENANITEDCLINESHWVTITRETKIAQLLGVAGTDIPINDIKKLMMPFMLGVNGYAFIVTNNGFILIHPDLRPLFQGILKPAYNSVDMIEIELMDDENEPRDFNETLVAVRESIIEQQTGSKTMTMKSHMDNMRRATRTKRKYFWTPIKNTPFTLVIAYPEDVGANRLQIVSDDEIHRMHVKGLNFSTFFSGHRWRIHPDWLYCKNSSKSFETPELELLYFLGRMAIPGWKWPTSRTPLPPEHEHVIYCDRNLMQALVVDAKLTEWFTKNLSFKDDKAKDDKDSSEMKHRFGITVIFMATQSGLTRWQEFYSNLPEEARPEQDFSENNKRAIDEIWYKRAVDQYMDDPLSFVYSVPFDAGFANDTLVTATRAVFVTENNKSAPAAVVGFQFQHSALYSLFRNITNNCNETPCKYTCDATEVECFILDDNGYIVIGGQNDTGKFFGEVRGSLMQRLVDDNIYKQIKIFDYQAVCFVRKDIQSPASIMKTPFIYLLSFMKWFVNYLFFTLIKTVDSYSSYYSEGDAYDNYETTGATEPIETYSKSKEREFDRRILINKTRPEPCDHTMRLYQLNNVKDKHVFKTPLNGCERPFVVWPIPKSNLIILVVDTMCPIGDPYMQLNTLSEEFIYNSSLACFKSLFELSRRRPSSCINQHQNESQITLCGRGNLVAINFKLISILLAILKFVFL